ncbi:MAG: FAD:protein FMN transferase [Xanthomonadales bacterium]|nr:FAD:protein FMN transferase [Xanthomonadales bacterium]
MRPLRFVGMTLLTACLIYACQAPPGEHRARFFVFGTVLDVVVREAERQTVSRAFAEVQQAMQSLHDGLHAWQPGPLTELNEAFRAGIPGEARGDIETLIRASQQMEQASGGRFNAAAGRLVSLWGFHTSQYPISSPPPSPSEIRDWLAAQPSALDIHLDNGMAHSSNRWVQLDFGGIAKGYAVDRAALILEQHGLDSHLVNAGGDLKAGGATPEHPWRVGIRAGGEVVGGLILEQDAAVFTSGSGERFGQIEGERYPHILDPRSGMPVAGLQSVTVLVSAGSGGGWYADAAATALMVAGPSEWPQVAVDLGLESVMVVLPDGRIEATRSVLKQFEPAQGVRERIREVVLPRNAGAVNSG